MEILLPGINLLKHDTDTNRRLAMLSIDNSVELMIKTFLGLPQRVTGIKLTKKDLEEISQSLPRLLDAIHEHAPDKLRDYDISEIEWFHRLRNELYHQGNGAHRRKAEGRRLNSLPSAIAGRSFEHFADSAKGWFYVTADERNDFAATANAKGSCSLRIFDSDTGQFLKKQYARGNYQEAFRDVLGGAKRLRVQSQPNLERDCRPQLPATLLHELKQQSHPQGP